jgi:hypothetical protein
MDRTLEGLISTVCTRYEHVNLKVLSGQKALRSQVSNADKCGDSGRVTGNPEGTPNSGYFLFGDQLVITLLLDPAAFWGPIPETQPTRCQ